MSPRSRGHHPFLDQPMPIAIAHRGGAGEAPQNTEEAFSAAVDLGYRCLETDAHVTSDGVVVAFHNPCLDDVTDRTGAIAALTIAEVEQADAGYSFSRDGGRTFPFRGRGVRVPRLAALLERWPDAYFLIDPKTDDCVEPLAGLMDEHGVWDRVCFGSLSDRRIRRIRELGRDRACTSTGTPRTTLSWLTALLFGRMRRGAADCYHVPVRVGGVPIVTSRLVRAAHRAGLPVHVWTVSDEATMHHLLDRGVNGIMTDRPRLLLEVLAGRDLPIQAPRQAGYNRPTPRGGAVR